jgi:hypothetical protein
MSSLNKKRILKVKAFNKKVLTPTLFVKRHWVAMLVFLLSLFAFFPYYYRNSGSEFYPKIGEVSKETIIAPFSFDIIKTEQEISTEKERLTHKILPVFRYDA